MLQEKNNTGSGDLKKQTALHHATIGGSAECVRLLIRYHAPVDQPDKVLLSTKFVYDVLVHNIFN